MTSNLLDLPFIPALLTDGTSTVLSLSQLMGDLAAVADIGDGPTRDETLSGVALRRLVHALVLAAQQDDVTTAMWVTARRDHFDLLHPERPFAQCAAIRDRLPHDRWLPAGALPLWNAGAGPVLTDHDHSATGTTYDLATAARLLLIRNAFATGQKQPMPGSAFGPDGSNGRACVGNLRPHLWVDTGDTLADSLAASTVPGDAGVPYLTWPDGLVPGDSPEPTGQAQTLTWPSRATLLHADADRVTACSYGNGLVYPVNANPQVAPNTVFVPGKDDPTTGVTAKPHLNPVRVMRTLLTGWLARRGLLGHLRATTNPADRAGWTLRWSCLVAEQGRIDGAMDAAMPVPAIPDEQIVACLDLVTAAHKNLYKRCVRVSSAGRALGVKDVTARLLTETTPAFESHLCQLIPAVVTGALPIADAHEQTNACVDAVIASADHRIGRDRTLATTLTLEGARR